MAKKITQENAAPKKLTPEQQIAANLAIDAYVKKSGKKVPAGKPKVAQVKTDENPVIIKVRKMCEAKGLSALTTKDACSRVGALMVKYPEPPTDEQLKADLTVAKKNNALWALKLWRNALIKI